MGRWVSKTRPTLRLDPPDAFGSDTLHRIGYEMSLFRLAPVGALVPFHHPDVAVLHLAAVALEEERPRLIVLRPAAAGRPLDLDLVVNEYAVVPDADHGVGGLLALVELGGLEFHVVGLPGQRWKAHVHQRSHLTVDAAALVVRPLEAEAVQHLDLVTVLEVDAAVAAALSRGEGHIGKPEFDVDLVILERFLAVNVAAEQM